MMQKGVEFFPRIDKTPEFVDSLVDSAAPISQHNIFSLLYCRHWEQELTRARKLNRKPRLRNALLKTFWKSCVVDGLLVLIYVLVKSIMPVFLAQLLIQFQLPPKIDNATSTDSYESTTSTEEFTTMPAISRSSNDDDESIIFEYMMFIW